jgi:hypothetical protein
MEEFHKYTEEQKREWFGEGPWVKEPDSATFEHLGIKCLVYRVVKQDGPDHFFGGHFCGYCLLPDGHPWTGKEINDIDAVVHGGVTFNHSEEMGPLKGALVGFDCAHSGDLVPSMHSFKRTGSIEDIELFEWLLGHGRDTYESLGYVVDQCKILAKQVKEAIVSEQINREEYGR